MPFPGHWPRLQYQCKIIHRHGRGFHLNCHDGKTFSRGQLYKWGQGGIDNLVYSL
jgi:hypothetical protein